MKRLLALALVVAFVAGCKSPAPAQDPFLRTRIAPPGTGEVNPQAPGDPYYSPGANPGSTDNGAGGSYTPPGGFDFRQGNRPRAGQVRPISSPPKAKHIPLSSRESSTTDEFAELGEDDAAAGAYPDEQPYEDDSAVRLASATDDEEGEVYQAVAEEAGYEEDSQQSIVERGTPSKIRIVQRRVAATDEDSVVEEEIQESEDPNEPLLLDRDSSARPIEPDADEVRARSSGQLSYDPRYRWLQGRLEYSQSDQKWRLRYIPIDGETDDYGGSVVLPDAKSLAGYRAGQLVLVHGAVRPKNASAGSYAPDYSLEQIEPVEP